MLNSHVEAWTNWVEGRSDIPSPGALYLKYIVVAYDRHASAHARLRMCAEHPVFLDCLTVLSLTNDEEFIRRPDVLRFFSTATLDQRAQIAAMRRAIEAEMRAMRNW